MKKDSSGRTTRNPTPNILGAIPLQVSEEDAGRLIGGIVEKGFSDDELSGSFGPSAAPRPTVLPFPVARHRSHGPYWAPKVENFNDNGDAGGNAEEDEDEDVDRMDLVAAVANPVQRKEKRSLDFSQWQEIVENEPSSVNHDKKKERHMSPPEVAHEAGDSTSDKNMQISELENTESCRDSFMLGEKQQENLKMEHVQKSDMVPSFAARKLVGGGDDNLESQIDSENRVRLANMPVNEIAKAQAEIMAKLKPGLINALKKRGQNKVRKQENSGFTAQRFVGGKDGSAENQIYFENCVRLADMSAEDITEAQAEVMAKLNPEIILEKQGQDKIRRQESSLSGKTNSLQHEKNTPNIKRRPDNFASDKPVEMLTGDAMNDGNSSDISPKNSIAWDAWSKRVERVRDMRFSLDGNIIISDFVCASNTGIASSESEYNPNNVSERDFLRTEGDPGAAGYTIKEAVSLTRSVVPGQRTLALHLIASILNRAVCNICQNQVGSSSAFVNAEGSVDWEAIWAFALGPEPELALSLRISLDDNHNSVVLACAKAIQCVLSFETNETIFDFLERTPIYAVDFCTAPVFRTKPDVNAGFLRGGFWKYNTKPSNILHFGEGSSRVAAEGEHTIQDDVIVAGQDVAAGLVRMGILTRIYYLLETDPSGPLEECLISILIAISRHSPTCAAAIMDSGKIVPTVASRFISKGHLGINSCKIKSVTLFKVLAQVEKNNCLAFIKRGILQQVTWHLFQHKFSVDQWIKSRKEACKLLSALLVEQIRLWKVFIHYGYCISDFPDLFSSLCIWLSVPDLQKLIDNDVIDEYCAITSEVYLLLGVLAGRLPNLYFHIYEKAGNTAQDEQDRLWHQYGSIVDQALEWIVIKHIPHVSILFDCQNSDEPRTWPDSEISPILWVISSVMNMFSSVLKVLMPADIMNFPAGHLPWLPEFVPKLGLEIIANGYFRFSGVSGPTFNDDHSKSTTVVEYLRDLRFRKEPELAVLSLCCLQGVIQVVALVEKLIRHMDLDIRNPQFKNQFKHQHLSREDKVLTDGMLKSSVGELRDLLMTLEALICKEWQCIQIVEIFGRGGPAPGVGVGWGASGGGYWSLNTLLAQQDSRLLVYLLEVTEMLSDEGPLEPGQINLPMQMLNAALSACLIVGPGDGPVIDKLFKFIFQVSVLKNLEVGIHGFLSNGKQYGSFGWKYTEEEFLLFANVLTTHFCNRWLSVKKKRKTMDEDNYLSQRCKKDNRTLETIYEDLDTPNTVGKETSFRQEWARQRLPLPIHWFLSAISTIENEKRSIPGVSSKETPSNFIDITKAGLFFLLGVEAMPTFLNSPVKHVPIVWKLHAMSVSLSSGMDVLHDEKSRDVFETLQNVYGVKVDENGSSLHFGYDIHKNYSTFIEMLVEQFAAESYGDEIFGRQIAIYLHQSVEASIRLATWNALSNARVLELLPPLPKCLMKAEGYLQPVEDNERILESYVKSWVSGALDKAAARSSMAFSVALHNLSSFIFGRIGDNMLPLRNRLVKSLVRDYSRRQHHEGIMVKLICYQCTGMMSEQSQSQEAVCEIEERLKKLKDMSDGNETSVEKLRNHIESKRELC